MPFWAFRHCPKVSAVCAELAPARVEKELEGINVLEKFTRYALY